MYAEKLKTEIFEHRHREAVYVAKRTELLEIENAYRVMQKKHVGRSDNFKSKIITQDLV